MRAQDFVSVTLIRGRNADTCFDRNWNCLHHGKFKRKQWQKHETWTRDRLLKKYHSIGHPKCVLCTETKHFTDGKSEMCTVHRNTKFSRRYIRNVYCAQKHKIFQSEHIKQYLQITNQTQPFTAIHTHQHTQLTHNKSHTSATHSRYSLMYAFQFTLCTAVGITTGGGRNASNG
jgi:hypothetical protein